VNRSMLSCFVSAFAPLGCLVPWDRPHRKAAGCWRSYPTGRAGGLVVVTDSGRPVRHSAFTRSWRRKGYGPRNDLKGSLRNPAAGRVRARCLQEMVANHPLLEARSNDQAGFQTGSQAGEATLGFLPIRDASSSLVRPSGRISPRRKRSSMVSRRRISFRRA
jgi:hypothetical protein